MSIAVRKAEIGDEKSIFEAEHAYIDCPWTLGLIERAITSDEAIALVAECDGEFCGYVTCDIGYESCELGNIAVVRGFRRRGVGKSLLSALLADISSRCIPAVFLQVRADNDAAIGLYTGLGFVAVGVRKSYYKDKDALTMRLNL